MEVQPKQPTAAGLAEWFTGDVYVDAITKDQGPTPFSLASVHLRRGPAARTLEVT